MSKYLKNTKNYSFSLTGDGGLLIRLEPITLEHKLEETFVEVYPGYTCYKDRGTIVCKLKIHNYFEAMDSPVAGQVLQTVLSVFSHSFVAKQDQREQLAEGLRYFFFSHRYKTLGSDRIIIISKLRKIYDKIKERLPLFEKEYNGLIEKARILHLQEPFVASTGTMIYSSRDAIWLASESLNQSPSDPEYLYIVDAKTSLGIKESVFTGRQKDCISFILDEQKKLYGICYDEIIKKEIEREQLNKNCVELEIVLDIPTEQRKQYIEEQEQRRVEAEVALDSNLTHLDRYATLKR